MPPEEEPDSETLQAQIDLSLSFAHELVSSWVKKPADANHSSSRDLEAELRDYIRKPPRLGVGAAVPDSSASSSRDAARLKGHILGKRKLRNVEQEPKSSDEEEESRAGAIRVRSKNDPFDMTTKKKKKRKKKASEANGVVPPTRPQTEQGFNPDPTAISPVVAMKPENKKQRKQNADNEEDTGTELSATDRAVSPNPIAVNGSNPRTSNPFSMNGFSPSVTEGSDQETDFDGIDMSLNVANQKESVVTQRDSPSPQVAALNLSGPPQSATDTTELSPKKKRKKRKKKKHLTPSGATA